MAGEIVVMLVEKVTFLREIRLSEQFLNWNKVLLLRFLVLREVNSSFCSKTQWQMFLLVSAHVVPIQIPINLGNTFLRISSIRKIVVAWILARVFAYLLSFFSQILDSIYWTVLIFYFDLLWMVWHWKPAIANDGETESLHFLSNKGRKSIGSIWLGVRGHFTKNMIFTAPGKSKMPF